MNARWSSIPSLTFLILFLSTWPVFNACRNHQEQDSVEAGESRVAPSRLRGRDSWGERRQERERMVATHIQGRGIKDPRVLKAMRDVPRHFFVLESDQRNAYRDEPRGIGERQTISQPYIVAFMTEALDLKPEDRVLEIGTGSGYQAAILAELVDEVYTIEIIPSLGKKAKALLYDMGFDNVHARIGDGYKGWPEKAPFDAVIVTAAPDHVPPALIEQLKTGGHLVIPVGSFNQELKLIEKTQEGMKVKSILQVRFVPMTGEAEK